MHVNLTFENVTVTFENVTSLSATVPLRLKKATQVTFSKVSLRELRRFFCHSRRPWSLCLLFLLLLQFTTMVSKTCRS
jgi:hypothetical protein